MARSSAVRAGIVVVGLGALLAGCTPGPLRDADIRRPYRSWGELERASREGPDPEPDASFLGEDDVRLDEVIEVALARNPALRGAHAAWVAAKARVPQAGSWMAPFLGYMLMQAPTEGEVLFEGIHRVEVRQTIPFWPRLEARAEVAAGAADVVGSERLAEALDVAVRASRRYHEIVYIDDSLAIVGELVDLTEGVIASAEFRYSSGIAPQADLLTARIALSRLEILRIDLERRRVREAARLNALVDRDPDAPVGAPAPGSTPEGELLLDELVEAAVEGRPEVGRAEAAVRRDEAAHDEAVYGYVPDLAVMGRYGMAQGRTDRFDLMAGIQLPWLTPSTWWRTTEAEADLARSRARRRSAERSVAADVAEAVENVRAARETLTHYREVLIPRAEDSLESALTSYESDRAGMALLLRTLEDLLEARRGAARVEADLGIRWAELERAVGRPVE